VSPRDRLAARVRVLLVVMALAASACASQGTSAREGSTGAREVIELERVSALRDQFNRDSGKARVILLLSPT
jgi:hypothetical protein